MVKSMETWLLAQMTWPDAMQHDLRAPASFDSLKSFTNKWPRSYVNVKQCQTVDFYWAVLGYVRIKSIFRKHNTNAKHEPPISALAWSTDGFFQIKKRECASLHRKVKQHTHIHTYNTSRRNNVLADARNNGCCVVEWIVKHIRHTHWCHKREIWSAVKCILQHYDFSAKSGWRARKEPWKCSIRWERTKTAHRHHHALVLFVRATAAEEGNDEDDDADQDDDDGSRHHAVTNHRDHVPNEHRGGNACYEHGQTHQLKRMRGRVLGRECLIMQ